MVAFVKIIRWRCPECDRLYDTQITNEHPLCVHEPKRIAWRDGKPEIEGRFVSMLRDSERWA